MRFLRSLIAFFRGDTRLSLKIFAGSLLFGLLGVTPLLLYIVFGPADGNPIGLGLLAMLAVLVAQGGLAAGMLRLFWELVTGQR